MNPYGGFHKWGYPKIDGSYGKTLLKWMIWRYPYFRKLPYEKPPFFHIETSLLRGHVDHRGFYRCPARGPDVWKAKGPPSWPCHGAPAAGHTATPGVFLVFPGACYVMNVDHLEKVVEI